jgi:general nucleoside transport system permease protein
VIEQDAGLLSLLPPLAVVLRQATPLALAALGGVFSERAGVINIALEGMMLIGAFTGLWVGQVAGALVGMLAAIGVGGLLGIIHLLLTQRLRMNHIISGVAINILAVNGTTFLLRRMFNQAEPPREAHLSPTLPPTWFVVAALLLPLIAHFLFYRTSIGLRLRAVGESPESARMAGVSPAKLRLVGVLISGMLAGMAGAYLSVAEFGRFSSDMVSGRGFIALAAVICGRWTPLGAALAALAFGFFDALQIRLQGTVKLPPELLLSLPYVLTIIAAIWLRSRPPAALGAE